MHTEDFIQFGRSRIDYTLVRQSRKSMRIEVHPTASVCVLAPEEASAEKVKEKVTQKAPWILKQQEYFLSFHPFTAPREYIGGETHLYLGKQYKLKLVTASTSSVKLQGGQLVVITPDKTNKTQIEKQIKAWYKAKATAYFHRLLKNSMTYLNGYDIELPILSLRWMSKRWGSCSPSGKIILNTELIKAPRRCIEYVIVHELCHLIEPNHSRKFFTLLDTVYPDWPKLKEQLERFMA